MEESRLDVTLCLFGSGLGWLGAIAICALFRWVRHTAPQLTALPGVGLACLWLLGGLCGSFQQALVFHDPAWVYMALFTLLPLGVGSVIAWWHRKTLSVSLDIAFGTLMSEFLIGLICAGLLFLPSRTLSYVLLGSLDGTETMYQCAIPALMLSLIIEEIAGPVRRRTRTEALP